ncbi:MAG: hypothetical protein A2915_00450 [Candidatus Yanofskybacteria bacterium RIFCSPLOWO2_01_FULL_41_34]|uniref:Uncharacterized protein n=1 Tax=Candidatus Yanofskybacteria bacterium RIFCSPHIGHO2_01_FULL_41_26 TaxID=1802661 RepID=A0A1F8EC89_9BACT|nr:MAG: hypothetical protein A2649_02485 [Candidatus Yanofskybacteria bacterium RIFCSPHIGHO2_01_FULL_41_26]OGN22369.1 MAG: hypothetical protein A2915_00450 [Candidatus Yanofskybacteria bacterium RIFCSPLOWO2_01_FULL_41_34]
MEQEPKIEREEYLGENIVAQIREDVKVVEQSLQRATKGTEPIQEGGIEKLKKAQAILKEARSFLEVL